MLDQITTDILLYSAAELSRERDLLIDKRNLQKEAELTQRREKLARAAESEDPKEFLAWFGGIEKKDVGPPVRFRPSDQPLTGQEVSDPPLSTERGHFDLLRSLPPRFAALPSFWTSYQVEMVRRGLIDPADLARSPGGTSQTGRALLQKAIRQKAKRRENKRKNRLDQCVRTILRQLGGLPEERGNVTVFVDCRLSRAWWRGHISHQVAEDIDLDVGSVWEFLRIPDGAWEQLTQHGVRKLTVVGDRNIRSALIARLMEADLTADPKKRRERIQGFLSNVGVRCAYQALGLLTPQENLAIFREMDI